MSIKNIKEKIDTLLGRNYIDRSDIVLVHPELVILEINGLEKLGTVLCYLNEHKIRYKEYDKSMNIDNCVSILILEVFE